MGGEKDDGNVTGFFTLPYRHRRVDAVHLWHLDVEQNKTEILLQQVTQGLLSGGRLDQILIWPLEHGLESHQVGGLVIHHQDVDLGKGTHFPSVTNWIKAPAISSARMT